MMRIPPSERARRSAATLLFPGCDPRGVMSRALDPAGRDWSTRPDAMLFGWMLALGRGIEPRAAARAVLDVHARDGSRRWRPEQRALLEALSDLADGTVPPEGGVTREGIGRP